MRTAIKRTILLVGLPALAVAVVSFGALTRGTRPEIPPGPTPANEAEALAAWESVLETYVDERGRVDFAGLSGDRGRIEAYLRWVADADTSRMGEEERLAFRINAYNALAMYGVVLASIPEDFGSIWEKVRFFVVPKHEIAGRRLSLYDFENKVIREEGDARIHVALNCMARSCPRLPREPFRAETLDAQLDREARRFYNEERNVRVDHGEGVVRLSKILDFYAADFLAEAPSLPAYANRFREGEIPEGYGVEFFPYDWTVNRQTPG